MWQLVARLVFNPLPGGQSEQGFWNWFERSVMLHASCAVEYLADFDDANSGVGQFRSDPGWLNGRVLVGER